jgi:predicted dehydrogenase
MIAEGRIDAAIVCTPHPEHRAPAVGAAEAGVHVLVEKPLASSLADCDAMIAAAARRQVKLGVVSQRRFFEPVARMKAAIDAGKIGAPVLATVAMYSWRDENYYRSDPWRGKWATEGGGVLINQSPHNLDLLQWLMGPIEEISGYYANLNHPYIEVEDTALAMIRFRSGALGSVVVSLSQKPGIHTKIHVHGANGASVGAQTDSGATFIAGMTGVAEPPLNDLWTIPGEEHLLPVFEAEDRALFRRIDFIAHYHTAQVRDFLRAVLEDRPPLATGEDGRKVVEIIAAIYRSSKQGGPVRLPLRDS